MGKTCKFKDCKKKLNVVEKTIGKCRCGKSFCSLHRLNHDCTYDYRAEINEEKFIEENKCVADKMKGEKI